MGLGKFFSGLTGSKKTPEFEVLGFDRQLPPFLQEAGREIGTGSFNLFRSLIQSGETPQERRLFAESRKSTRDDVQRLGRSLGLSLDRAGFGSSGLKNRRLGAVLLGMANVLGRQDAQRAAALLQRRLGAAESGLNAALATSRQSQLVPVLRQHGLFEGFGTELIRGGVRAGASFLGGKLGGL